jgi:uncharacterized protein (TIGR02757 family)
MSENILVDLKDFLDEKVEQYNKPAFIENDPIYIPHLFTQKEDIEISAFLVATFAWGQRKSIIQNGQKLVKMMDMKPYDFIKNANKNDFKPFEKFVHRTFNGSDCKYFLYALKKLYVNENGLEGLFKVHNKEKNVMPAIARAHKEFFKYKHLVRTEKHFSNPDSGSAAKRINMFLRWMVRKDNCGVDFGIWKNIQPKQLICPLDVHSGRVARKLGLLIRKQDDRKAAEELTDSLLLLDKNDPVKYDFALFGLGVNEKF